MYDAGILTVYSAVNGSPNGSIPKKDKRFKLHSYYDYITVGMNRFYTALQNAQQIEEAVQCPEWLPVSTDDIVVLENNLEYRVRQFQKVTDKGMQCTRMYLERIGDNYE